MKIYIIIAQDNDYSKKNIKSFLNKENAFNCVRQLTFDYLEYVAYDALNMVKGFGLEITQENIETYILSEIRYYIQELEIEDN